MLITCPKCSTKYQIPDEAHLSAGRKLKCSHCQNVFVLKDQIEDTPKTEEVVMPPEMVEIDPPKAETSSEQKVFEDQPVFQDDVPQPFMPVANTETSADKKSIGSWAAIISLFAVLILLGLGIFYKDVIFNTFAPQMIVPSKNVKKSADITVPEVSVEKNVAEVVAKENRAVESYVEEIPEVVMLPQIQSVRFEKRLDPTPTIRIEGVLKNGTSAPIKLPAKVRAIAYNEEGAILFEKEIYLTDLILPAGEERPFFGSYQPAPEGVQWVDVTF